MLSLRSVFPLLAANRQKRPAEDVIADLSGVPKVQNNLRVQESSAWDRSNAGDTEPSGAP